MNGKFMAYAIFVTALTTWNSWSHMIRSAVSSGGGGSSWSSHGGSYGGGGGGHK
jgi:hypothetical protein